MKRISALPTETVSGDINISKAINEHRKNGKLATVTATQPKEGLVRYQ